MLRTKDSLMRAFSQSRIVHPISVEDREQLQAHLRRMYQDLSSFCEEHNLCLFAAYGTLLGAIRHRGFIPWDDDLDLFMPRKDYNRFIRLAYQLPSPYRLYAPNSPQGAISRFAKLVDTSTRFTSYGQEEDERHGIFIDIFPLENGATCRWFSIIKLPIILGLMYIADSVLQYKHNTEEYRELMKSIRSARVNYLFRQAIGFVFSFISYEKWYNKLDRLVQNSNDSAYYSESLAWSDKRCIRLINKKLYEPCKDCVFDDIIIKIPNQPEQLLDIYYGDWKRVPPMEQRWQHYVKSLEFNSCSKDSE